jgi:hypothetical protein
MENKIIESKFSNQEITNESKHFRLFSIFTIILVIQINFIGQNFDQGTNEMLFVDLYSLIEIPLMSIIILRTYKTKEALNFKNKVSFISMIIIVKFIAISILNLINPFNRIINTEHIIKGLTVTSISSVISLILCLPVLAIVENKKVR